MIMIGRISSNIVVILIKLVVVVILVFLEVV